MAHCVDFSPMRFSRVPGTLAYLFLEVHAQALYGRVGVSLKRVIFLVMHVLHGYVARFLTAP